MSLIYSNCCLTSNFHNKPTKQYHHHQLPFSPLHPSSSPTSFFSPPNFTSLSTKNNNNNNNNNNLVLQASFGNAPLSISVDHKNSQSLIKAADVVRNFYDGINRRNLAAVEPLIAQDCVYEDLIFPRPFVGRKSILEFFGNFIGYISSDLQFVIDAISEEDSSAVGVTWHLEWKGRPFPFSKGCSFYQLEVVNGIRQIVYARDSVEPAMKPGESALIAIRGVLWLLQRFPKLEERL